LQNLKVELGAPTGRASKRYQKQQGKMQGPYIDYLVL